MAWPTRVLMVDPQYFDVEYAINPHMLDENGELNKVDKDLAKKQWTELKNTFEKLKLNVEVLPGQESLPDMVFCANQTFPFMKEDKLHMVLSQMNSDKRQPEVQYFKSWAEKNDVTTHELGDSQLEGMGDVLWNYETEEVYAGYGFRTSPEVYTKLEKLIDKKIITFELKDDRFYHLDTCLSILSGDTAAYVREAFTEEGYLTLKKHFTNLIQIPLKEATEQLACNMCSPNGDDVIIQEGANMTNEALEAFGFNVIELDTREFIKSGGSVFCMKMLLP